MKKALFIMIPQPSHYYPTFGLAYAMARQGYTIVYTGTPNLRRIVEQEGFEFTALLYIDEYVLKGLKVALGLFLMSLSNPGYTRNRFREFLFKNRLINNLVDSVKPDVIFLDDTLGHYHSQLRGKATIIQLSTKLSPKKYPGIPPLNTYWRPKNNAIDGIISELYWFKHLYERRTNQFLQRLVFRGRDEEYFQKKYEHRLNYDRYYWEDKNTSFYNGLKHVPSLILAPVELEFPWHVTNKGEYYAYFPIRRNEERLLTEAYQNIINTLVAKRQSQRKLIYVTLGTLSFHNKSRAEKFLAKISKVLSQLNNVEAVIVTGALNYSLPATYCNVHYYQELPQLNLLPYCDLVITHGGLGTIKECLRAGVPMLLYPLNTDVDQPGNSARVITNGWGLRGKMTEHSVNILYKVRKLLSDNKYREACIRMQRRLIELEANEPVEYLLQKLCQPT